MDTQWGMEMEPPVPALTRHRDGRVIAGVCAGLSQRFGINVHFVRLAMALLSGLSAFGWVVYAMLWVLTPLEKSSGAPVTGGSSERSQSRQKRPRWKRRRKAAAAEREEGAAAERGAASRKSNGSAEQGQEWDSWLGTEPSGRATAGAGTTSQAVNRKSAGSAGSERGSAGNPGTAGTADTADTRAGEEDKGVLPDALLVVLGLVLGCASVIGQSTFGVIGTTGYLVILVFSAGSVLLWIGYDRGFDYALLGFGSVRVALISIGAGGALMIAAVALIGLNWRDNQTFAGTVFALVLIIAGIGVQCAPVLIRLWNEYNTAQAEKAAQEERARIAARIHDSVLQTLALIQKRADDPTEVARLARGQERELRQWLFGGQSNTSAGAKTLFGAVRLACGEVEDTFGVSVTPVTVGGDIPLTEHTQALVLAAREAMVNAAKYSGQSHVDVYAEHLDGVEIYVRDRGVGFDPALIGTQAHAHRHGIQESIIGRVRGCGGEVTIKSAPGEGTEVRLQLAEEKVGEAS